MRTLFITYDGLTDPLGQSQVLPYLVRLADKGHRITIISTEKKSAQHAVNDIKAMLDKAGIEWLSIRYTKNPQVISTLWDCLKLFILAIRTCRKETFDIIHCRSYIPSLIGVWIKRFFGVKFIFDMRGFYADERVDGRIWRQRNIVYRMLYLFFKQQERKFLSKADYTICLTERSRKEIHSWRIIPKQPLPIKVIPCCANVDQFNPERITKEERHELRSKIGIADSDFLLMYSGAIGTWYMLDEMFDFFNRLLLHSNAKFLFITYDDPENILRVARKKNISGDLIRIVKAKHSEVPAMLSICDLSIFFIRPLYSKMASSPAKQGEIMSMGIPIICNSNIGDCDRIISEADGGLIVRTFSNDDYDSVVNQIPELLLKSKAKIRNTAVEYFSLEKGANNYNEVYEALRVAKPINN